MFINQLVQPEGVEAPVVEKIQFSAHELDQMGNNEAIEFSNTPEYRAIIFKTLKDKYCVISTHTPTESELDISNTMSSAPSLTVEFYDREGNYSSFEIIPFRDELSGILAIYIVRHVGDKVEVNYFNNRSTYDFTFDQFQELLALPPEFEDSTVTVKVNERMKLLRKYIKTANTILRHEFSVDDVWGKAIADNEIWKLIESMDCMELNEEFFNLVRMQ